jgi:hypothetical protein
MKRSADTSDADSEEGPHRQSARIQERTSAQAKRNDDEVTAGEDSEAVYNSNEDPNSKKRKNLLADQNSKAKLPKTANKATQQKQQHKSSEKQLQAENEVIHYPRPAEVDVRVPKRQLQLKPQNWRGDS